MKQMTGHCCKVGRISDTHSLTGVDEELRERRTRADGPDSLRTLEQYVNRRVLRAAMADAGMEILDGDVRNAYRLLTADEVSSGMRRRVRQRLARDGIDVDRLERDFVSHPTVGSHLTDCLGVDRGGTGGDPSGGTERVEERIAKLQNRTEAVATDALEQLRTTGQVDAGELTVFVDVQVACGDCGAQFTVREFVERGSCECD